MVVQIALNVPNVYYYFAQRQEIVPTERFLHNNQMVVRDALPVVNVLHYPVQCCLLNALTVT